MQGLWAQSRGMESDPKYEQRELPALATRGGRPLSLLSANSPAAQPPLGKEFAFHFPGSGVVWAQNGRFVFGDIGLISYTGLNSLDTNALCAALAP